MKEMKLLHKRCRLAPWRSAQSGVSKGPVVSLPRVTTRARRRGIASSLIGALALIACLQASAGALIFPNSSLSTLVLPAPANLTVSRDHAVGQTVGSQIATIPGIATSSVSCDVTKTVVVNGTLAGVDNTVFSTDVSGIGVRFMVTAGWNGGFRNVPLTETFTPPASGSTAWYVGAVLVVTGPVQGGVLTSLPSLTVTFSGTCFSTVSQTFTITPGATITASTCTVTPPAPVNLPPVSVSNLLPIGKSGGTTNFAIALSCQPGANIYMTLTDATNPANTSSNLTLAPGSTARGVALRILYGGTAVRFGTDSAVAGNPNQFYVGASSSTSSVPLSAQLISVGPVMAGQVQGLATFTMSYQ